jgi:MFS family permease
VAFFNQVSGINAILYFAPRILGMTGLEGRAAFIQTIGIGITNLIFTMLGLWLIDRIGRRKLLYIGSIGYIASLGLIAAMFIKNEVPFRVATDALTARDAYTKLAHAQESGKLPSDELQSLRNAAAESLSSLNATLDQLPYQGDKSPLPIESSAEQVQSRTNQIVTDASSQAGSSGRFVLWGIFAFIAAHAIGQGTAIWVLISEVFPNEHRAEGQSLGSATHWVFAALLTLVFPSLVTHFSPGYVFAFFCFMMILQLVW